MAFPTTRWTLLAQATLNGDEAGRESLARMCEGYRLPVEMFLASRGHVRHEIEDLTQDFFSPLAEVAGVEAGGPCAG
jgi:hypothetical protein